MPTHSSLLYHSQRIPAHDKQFRAALLVMLHLRQRYGVRADRHGGRIRAALLSLERRGRQDRPAMHHATGGSSDFEISR